jgi:hypothetical protein
LNTIDKEKHCGFKLFLFQMENALVFGLAAVVLVK